MRMDKLKCQPCFLHSTDGRMDKLKGYPCFLHWTDGQMDKLNCQPCFLFWTHGQINSKSIIYPVNYLLTNGAGSQDAIASNYSAHFSSDSYNNECYLFSAVMQQIQKKNIIRICFDFISSQCSNIYPTVN